MPLPGNLSIANAISFYPEKNGRNMDMEEWLHSYADGLTDKTDQRILHRIADAIAGYRANMDYDAKANRGNGYSGP